MNPTDLKKGNTYSFDGSECVYMHQTINGYMFRFSSGGRVVSYSEVKHKVKEIPHETSF